MGRVSGIRQGEGSSVSEYAPDPNDYYPGPKASGDAADFTWISGGGNPFTEPAGNRVAQLLDAKATEYDTPAANFSRIAEMWTALISSKLLPGEALTPIEVGLFQICVKLTREQFAHKEDNVLDIEGYAECIRRVNAPATTALLTPGSAGSVRSYR